MILLNKNTGVNTKVNLRDLAIKNGVLAPFVMIQATSGTWTGNLSLEISSNGTDFVPLTDENGSLCVITTSSPLSLLPGNVWVRCAALTSSNAVVEIN